jgi:hypothetical protein
LLRYNLPSVPRRLLRALSASLRIAPRNVCFATFASLHLPSVPPPSLCPTVLR